MRQIVPGSTDQSIDVFVPDSSATNGAGLTGLAFNTASLSASYRRGPLGARAAITLATQTVTGAHSDGGFVEIDATNMPGIYRLDLPDAVVASGVPYVTVYLRGAANMAPVAFQIQLSGVNVTHINGTAAGNAFAFRAGVARSGSNDLWGLTWYRDGNVITDTITAATITVFDIAAGSNLFSASATVLGSTGTVHLSNANQIVRTKLYRIGGTVTIDGTTTPSYDVMSGAELLGDMDAIQGDSGKARKLGVVASASLDGTTSGVGTVTTQTVALAGSAVVGVDDLVGCVLAIEGLTGPPRRITANDAAGSGNTPSLTFTPALASAIGPDVDVLITGYVEVGA